MRKKRNLSLASQGVNYKLRIALYLMSVLPLLVCFYLVSRYILPTFGIKMDIVLSLLVCIVIIILGFVLVKEVFYRIVSVSTEAKLIAAGNFDVKVNTGYGDEIGDLGGALNQLTERIRSNMNELKDYGEKTRTINFEIQKRVLMLSSLLQISSLISQGEKLDEICRVTIEKSRFLADSDVAYVLFKHEERNAFYMKAVDGIDSQYLARISIEPNDIIFNKFNNLGRQFILDNNNILPDNIKVDFCERFRLINSLILPVAFKGKVVALFGIGNSKTSFVYKKDDVELLDIFVKQLAIAVENDKLMHRVEKLEIKDTLTGLFNAAFIRNRLQEEIKRAITYQRPCAFILLCIDNFNQFVRIFGALEAEFVLKKVTFLIKGSVSEIETVARYSDDKFAIVLPEKNKRYALEIAEDIRKKIEFSFSEDKDINRRLTVSGSISENPLDGIDAEELINKAGSLLGGDSGPVKNKIII